MRLFHYGTLCDPDLLAKFAVYTVLLRPRSATGVALPLTTLSNSAPSAWYGGGWKGVLAFLWIAPRPSYGPTPVVVQTAHGNTPARAGIDPGGRWP
jgi:hypothetical protein